MKTDKRQQERFVLTGYIPGHFSDQNKTPLDYVLFDISEKGLGVFFDPGPTVGETVNLSLANGTQVLEYSFRVQWTQREEGLENFSSMQSMKRCGLQLMEMPNQKKVEESDNLISVFVSLDGVTVGDNN